MMLVDSYKNFFELFLYSKNDEGKNNYFSVLGISWALHLLYAFYTVAAFYIGVKSYDYISSSNDFSYFVTTAVNYKFQKIGILTLLFEVALYPFVFQLGFKFWKYVLGLYSKIFEKDDQYTEDDLKNVIFRSFSANLFLAFPIFGKFLSYLSMYYFLFIGMRRDLKYTNLQATLVLLTPLFLMFLCAVFAASYVIFLVSLI